MLQGVLAELVNRGLAVHDADVGIDREARRAQPFQKLVLAFHVKLCGLGDGVDEGGQIALGRDGGVLLAQRSGGGVAAVGEALLERELAARALTGVNLGVVEHDLVVLEADGVVEALEGGAGHVDLAAHLDGLRKAHGATLDGKVFGNVLDLHDVCRHVLTHAAIATGGGSYERAALVGERDGGAIDLELAAIGQAMTHCLARAAQPLVELVKVHRIIQRVHAVLMLGWRELLGHAAADGLGWRIGRLQLWVAALELGKLAIERIVDRIGKLGGILEVVLVASPLQRRAQLVDAFDGICRCIGRRIAHQIEEIVLRRSILCGHFTFAFLVKPSNSSID